MKLKQKHRPLAIRRSLRESCSEEIEIDSVETLSFFFKILPLLILQHCL